MIDPINYKVLSVPLAETPTELEERLRIVGSIGWDLVGIVQLSRGPCFVFKRRKSVEDAMVDAYLAEQKSSTAYEASK